MLGWKDSDQRWIDPTIAFRTESAKPVSPGLDLDRAWWMAKLDLRGVSMTELLAQAGGGLVLPFFYDEPARERRAESQIVSVYVQRGFIVRANTPDSDLAKMVPRMVLGGVLPGPLPVGIPSVGGPPIEVPEGSTVVAVIDSGIAFAHELFRTAPTDSRVHFAWIMDGTPSGPGHQGRLLEKPEIDALLASNTHSGLLDEDAFYAQAGLIDFRQPGIKPAALRLSHGTHVMGLAAGMRPADADLSRPIVCVQLPTELVMDVTGSHLEVALGHALDFILACARRFRIAGDPNRAPAVAINFSFGNFAGPHDGTGVIERLIDQALAPGPSWRSGPHPEVRMTLPAGNANLDRCHAEIGFSAGVAQATLDWRVLPDDRTMSHVELWLPWRASGGDDLVAVTVEPPGGPESPPVGAQAGLPPVQLVRGGTQVGSLGFVRMAPPTDRGVIQVSIYPTASPEAGVALAPPGIWKIRVTRKNLSLTETVQVWIKRDDTLPGFPVLGRQSYFDNPGYRRFDAIGRPLAVDPAGDTCIVRRSGTLSGFACGDLPSVIGGYVASAGREIADYSAAGPITPVPGTTGANRAGPDAAARSDDSPVLHGVLSAGSRSGSLVAMGGTSVATPQVARWIAIELAAGRAGDRQAVWDKAAADEMPGPGPSEFRAGGGRMTLPRPIGPPRL